MTDKVLCPWCGSEMQLNQQLFISFYVCRKCGSHGPVSLEGAEAARTAALRRYEPPLRPMTKDEVKEHTVTRDASPLWMEWKVYEDMDEWVTSPAIKSLNIEENYGRVWRCWPRKPTEQERQAAGWEDAE